MTRITGTRRAVLLDRDGVINRHRPHYVKNGNEFELLADVPDSIRALRKMGYKIIVITNQSAVGRGIVSKEKLAEIHKKMMQDLEVEGAKIDAIYVCPHRPDQGCACRKPGIDLILRAESDFRLDLGNSWLIGDEETDIQAGERAGCRTIRVKTDTGLSEALEIIERHNRTESRNI